MLNYHPSPPFFYLSPLHLPLVILRSMLMTSPTLLPHYSTPVSLFKLTAWCSHQLTAFTPFLTRLHNVLIPSFQSALIVIIIISSSVFYQWFSHDLPTSLVHIISCFKSSFPYHSIATSPSNYCLLYLPFHPSSPSTSSSKIQPPLEGIQELCAFLTFLLNKSLPLSPTFFTWNFPEKYTLFLLP